MDTITVNKTDLIETVTLNRDQHRAQFLRAMEKYREQAIAELDKMIEAAKAGDKIKRAVSLPEPQDYTDSYNTVLGMLAWEQNDTVELDRGDYERYIENKWEWARAFAGSTQSYLG